eukprot:scaffold3263_cov110-Amphora_coffeaeformis.AAC.1
MGSSTRHRKKYPPRGDSTKLDHFAATDLQYLWKTTAILVLATILPRHLIPPGPWPLLFWSAPGRHCSSILLDVWAVRRVGGKFLDVRRRRLPHRAKIVPPHHDIRPFAAVALTTRLLSRITSPSVTTRSPPHLSNNTTRSCWALSISAFTTTKSKNGSPNKHDSNPLPSIW